MAQISHEELLERIDKYASIDVAQLEAAGLSGSEVHATASVVRERRLGEVHTAIGLAMIGAIERSQRDADKALQMVALGNSVLAEHFGTDDKQARGSIEGLDLSHVGFKDFSALATRKFRPDTATRLWNCLSRAYDPVRRPDVGLFKGDISRVGTNSGEEWNSSGATMDLAVLAGVIAVDNILDITNLGQNQLDLVLNVLDAAGIPVKA